MTIVSREITVTQGNINNNHLYLKRVLDLFPADVLGGANSSYAAPRTVRVLWGSEAVDTDIDCSKNIFRRRFWLARFFKENRICAGDCVKLEQLEPYLYRVSKGECLSHEAPQPKGPAPYDSNQQVKRAADQADKVGIRPSSDGPSEAAYGRSLRDQVVSRDRFTCQSCGRRTRGQVHHILPRSQGGPDTPANLVTLCGRCHMLISPIPVDVLCGMLGTSIDELLVQKSKVEIAISTWVLAHFQESGVEMSGPIKGQDRQLASTVHQRPAPASAIPHWKQPRLRAGKPWTEEEDAALLQDIEAGLPLEEIARRRRRGVHAIEVRLCKLGRSGSGR